MKRTANLFANAKYGNRLQVFWQRIPKTKPVKIRGKRWDWKWLAIIFPQWCTLHIAKEYCFKKESQTETGVSPKTKLFFSCLGNKSMSEEATWFRGIKNNIVRILFSRVIRNKEPIDHAVEPVYGEQIKLISNILTEDGFVYKRSLKKLIFVTLRIMVSGRTEEIVCLLLETFRWDGHYKQVFAELRTFQCTHFKTKICKYTLQNTHFRPRNSTFKISFKTYFRTGHTFQTCIYI